MSRYMERAENMARILGVTSACRCCCTSHSPRLQEQNLVAPLRSPGTATRIFERYPDARCRRVHRFHGPRRRQPVEHLHLPARARDNAHAVRWQITSEMWETLNTTWLEMRSHRLRARSARAACATFFDWVKERSHLFRGVTFGTIMRGEAFNFSRLGTFIERADATARILDVKYHILLPRVEDVGGALDYYQWTALLRSVSRFETYRTIYRDQITPINVAELLILRDACRARCTPA